MALVTRTVPVLAGLVIATSVAACDDDASGVIGPGQDGQSPEVSASINPNQLCRWKHFTHFTDEGTDPYVVANTRCGESRQVFHTCYVALYGPTFARIEHESHGGNFCQAYRAYNGAYKASEARGSEALFHLRLDNPRRRWTGTFVSGKPISCDRYFNTNGQHILRCYRSAGNVPVAAQVLSAAGRSLVREACAEDFDSSECARLQRWAIRQADKRVLRRYLNRLTRGLGDPKLMPRSQR